MDRADLELFERSIRQATETGSGADLDAALADLGWADAFESAPRAAVAVLFELQGRAASSSSTLARVLGSDVLPAPGSSAPPGRLERDRVAVDGLARGATGPVLVVATGSGTVEVAADALDVTPVGGIDPTLGLSRVSGDAPGGSDPAPPDDWSTTVARARLAVGHELVRASRRMLELAREHAVERIQFAVP